ncbi:hypothetical protein OGAPHI_004528 [Ogataea philodendri]|uniref:Maltose/galactoside acetyltransferase domain-containing protein n=1 Tax=Ogataea philodendri TaxID=1378263 RepID=A0A9P8P7D7_9ASCO|nr:uncharacterized protein OGAPHI_004528 [Ogataea philodendri]KAH3666339.1 hypothetical protein OGAPHI_004528 [Ogataea philodendri]
MVGARTELDHELIKFARANIKNIPDTPEYEKMISGVLYDANASPLPEGRASSTDYCYDLSNVKFRDYGSIEEFENAKTKIVRNLFAKCGEHSVVEPPFSCDYGYNIIVGDNFYVNYNASFVDASLIIIGNNCMFGPNVSLVTATHPLDVNSRLAGEEYALPIRIGDNCWLGANVTILPGVTLGDNVVVGAGATVTKDVETIVTGSSRGIGKEIALYLGKFGCNVVVNYSNSEDAALSVADQINNSGGSAVVCQASVDDLSSHQRLVDAGLSFNTGEINILVHNAGVGDDGYLETLTESVFDNRIGVNLKGPVFLTQKVLPHFTRNNGRIVFLSSICARMGYEEMGVYSATKAAVEGLMRVWSLELGRKYHCTVNAVNPGPVKTDMLMESTPEAMKALEDVANATPAAPRIGLPTDIAPLVGFLCSDEASWTTGSVLNANGGVVPLTNQTCCSTYSNPFTIMRTSPGLTTSPSSTITAKISYLSELDLSFNLTGISIFMASKIMRTSSLVIVSPAWYLILNTLDGM